MTFLFFHLASELYVGRSMTVYLGCSMTMFLSSQLADEFCIGNQLLVQLNFPKHPICHPSCPICFQREPSKDRIFGTLFDFVSKICETLSA